VGVDERPFEDVRFSEGGFSIPELKWRELLFVGAMRAEKEAFVRDESREMPPFAAGDLFPPGVRFRAVREGGRVRLERVSGAGI
jgi:hypothetical protein